MKTALTSILLSMLTVTPALAGYGFWMFVGGTGQATESNQNQAYEEARQQAINSIPCLSGNVRGISDLLRNNSDNGDGTWTVTLSVNAQCWVGN